MKKWECFGLYSYRNMVSKLEIYCMLVGIKPFFLSKTCELIGIIHYCGLSIFSYWQEARCWRGVKYRQTPAFFLSWLGVKLQLIINSLHSIG